MPIFEYRATDTQGRPQAGTLHGATQEEAARSLVGRGWRIESIAPARTIGDPIPTDFGRAANAPPPEVGRFEPKPIETPSRPPSDALLSRRSGIVTEVLGPLFGRVALHHQLFFFRQLSAMLAAGVNPVQCLDTLGKQAQSAKLKTIIGELRDQTLAGRPMSFGMQRYPEVFSPLTLSLVRAGEQGGFLDDALKQVADYLEREIYLRNLIRRVTIYPKLVIGASIVILVAANWIIASLAPGSPISLSSPLTNPGTWLVLGPLLVGLFLFVRVGLHNPRIRHNWDFFITLIPWIGKTSKQFAMAKFGRALGALYRGGVPIHQGLKLAADACGNEYLRARMYPAFVRLEEGEGITETLRGTGAFNDIVLDMTATGEKTGNLDLMLNKMAEFYEGEAETRSVQMGWTVGVAALLLVAGYVGYLYVSNIASVLNKTYSGVAP